MPVILSSALELAPLRGNPSRQPTALNRRVVARVRFETSEPLGEPPTLETPPVVGCTQVNSIALSSRGMIRVQAIEGEVEPLVLAKPPLGRSGELRVRKSVHDALGADLAALGPHVLRVSAKLGQDIHGRRSVYLRLVLSEDFPNLPHSELPARLGRLQEAAAARCAEVLGPDFRAFVDFGGKKLR